MRRYALLFFVIRREESFKFTHLYYLNYIWGSVIVIYERCLSSWHVCNTNGKNLKTIETRTNTRNHQNNPGTTSAFI